jgi:hypothetical protein
LSLRISSLNLFLPDQVAARPEDERVFREPTLAQTFFRAGNNAPSPDRGVGRATLPRTGSRSMMPEASEGLLRRFSPRLF